jgi:hypothetical protein
LRPAVFIIIIIIIIIIINWDSTVNIAIGYRLGDRMIRIRFQTGAGSSSPQHHVQTGSGVHLTSCVQWVPAALSLGIKLPGREADHSPPSSGEVKKCV